MTPPFADRITRGRESEERFIDKAHSCGLSIAYLSQHRDNPKNSIERHFPDVFIIDWNMFIQIKNAIGNTFPTFLVEQKSFGACMFMSERGARVVIAFEVFENKFIGCEIEKIKIVSTYKPQRSDKASGTPTYVISKDTFREMFR